MGKTMVWQTGKGQNETQWGGCTEWVAINKAM